MRVIKVWKNYSDGAAFVGHSEPKRKGKQFKRVYI